MSASMFPARAGMSRVQHNSNKLDGNVPRASGDEPGKGLVGNRLIICSPRERG